MQPQKVEAVCKHLSPVTLQAIRKKVLQVPDDCVEYTVGSALVFWVADWLTGLQILAADQVRLLIEEFSPDIIKFGVELEGALKIRSEDFRRPRIMQLPCAKIGFLDRWQACMDGRDTFLDLKTGKSVPAIERRPLETIAYNLTALYLRYSNLMHVDDINQQRDKEMSTMIRSMQKVPT